jgi:hypothetical protein
MPVARMSEKVAKAIKSRYEQGATMEQIQKDFGYSRPVIRRTIEERGGTIRPRGRTTAIAPQLTRKLSLLSDILEEKPNEDTVKTIVDYALRHIDGRTFRKIDRRYSYNGALSQFRREHLENSYYVMGRLWRAVYRTVLQERDGTRPVKAADYGVVAQDVDLCLSVLNDADKAKILAWLDKTGDYVHLPNEKGVQLVVAECEKAMRSIVGSKLRFIYKYDPAFEAEDLVSYLRVVAYRVAVKYDWEKLDGAFAYQKCLNYTKRSLWNAAFLLIKENSAEDNGGTGNYNRLSRIGTDEREYQITTVSMDSGDDDEWLAIEETLGEAADTSCEVMEMVEQIGDGRLFSYLRLEYEDVPEFTEFVLTETGRDENDLYTEDYQRWRKLAQCFSGIRQEDRVAYKRQVMTEMGSWDKSRVNRRSK